MKQSEMPKIRLGELYDTQIRILFFFFGYTAYTTSPESVHKCWFYSIGLGSTLMIQNSNSNSNEKQCLALSRIGALTGHYFYEKKLKRTYSKKENDESSQFSLDTFINPMAYQTNHPVLIFKLDF